MFRSSRALVLLTALIAGAFAFHVSATPAFAQATDTAKSDKKSSTKSSDTKAKEEASAKDDAKSDKKLTPQQQKMKDCGAKWQAEKKAKGVSGKEAYQKFLSKCLKD